MTSFVKKSAATIVAMAMALACGLVGLGASNATQAFAADNPTSQEITISVKGASVEPVTFTKEDLKADEALNTKDVLGYLYRKPDGQWYTVALKDFITLDDLFDMAEVSEYWTPGAKLQFVGTDGVYTKYYPTYDECLANQSFFGDTTAKTPNVTVTAAAPAALGFTYSQTEIGANETAAASLGGNGWVESTRFGVGLNANTLMAVGTDDNMGKRMPYDLTEIVIIPA